MSWFSKFKRQANRAAQSQSSQHGINFLALGNRMMACLPELEKGAVDLHLYCARVADFYRDFRVEPVDPEFFISEARALDSQSQKRLALCVCGLDDPETRQEFARSGNAQAAQQVQLLFGFAKEHDVLTIEVLMDSNLRREEFIRHFIARLGSTVLGEAPEESRDRLQRLDYKQLLADADRAKMSASERVAYLKKLQEQQEQKLGRRSKI